MEPSTVQAASASTLSTASRSRNTGGPQSFRTNPPPLITPAAAIGTEPQPTVDASIGGTSCSWRQGRVVTCVSSATCDLLKAFRACCVDQPCSSSSFNTGCPPNRDESCQAGIPGPATRCCTDSANPACHTLLWSTIPDVPSSQVGSGILDTTPPPQSSAPPLQRGSSLLKAPAGTVLEVFLGAILIFVLVAISCVIVTRKMHAARRGELQADNSRSSVTISASPGRPGRDHGIPLSTSPEITHDTAEGKMDQPRGDDIERGSDASRV